MIRYLWAHTNRGHPIVLVFMDTPMGLFSAEDPVACVCYYRYGHARYYRVYFPHNPDAVGDTSRHKGDYPEEDDAFYRANQLVLGAIV
jgi:hypothetical protein